jgi:prepilin-type N-terminal cleavage/methylation domain-containing protein
MFNKKGFTFIEVVVVMGIVSLLFAISAPDLFKLQDRNVLQNTTTEIVSLLRQQQFNSMNSPQVYGVHFEQSKYTLYTGSEFVEGKVENTAHELSYPIAISSVLFPGGDVRFASGSGEIIGYSSTANTITLTDTVHLIEKTIKLNSLGVPLVQN